MTLQLAVQITGNAASLKQAAEDAKRVTDALGASIDAAGDRAGASAAGIDRAATAIDELAASEREAAGAAQGMGAAVGAAGDRAEAAAADIVRVTAASHDLAQAQRDVAAAATAAATATATAAASAQRAMGMAQQAQAAASGSRAGAAVPGQPAAAPAAAQAAASGLRPDQWKNLGFQANDIFTSLASGIPVTQVIAQQGGQVAQVLGDAPGGIAGGLKIVAGRAMEILTPVRLMTAGFLGAAAAVAYLGVSWTREQEVIRTGLLGIGAQSRATVADINRIAETAAAGGKISRGDARGVASAVAATGKVDVSNIQAITDLAPGYAKLFGKDMSETAADLARIFADPVKGAEELNARIGGLDAGTRTYIRTLVEQGTRQESILAVVRQFTPEITAAAEKTNLWAQAWSFLGSVAEATGRIVSKPFTTGTLQEQLDAAKAELAKAQTAARVGTVIGGGPDLARDRAQKNLAARQAEVDRAQKAVDDAAAAPGRKASAELSRQAEDAVRALQPEIDQLETLNSRILLLQKTQGDLDALSSMSVSARKQFTDALAAAKGGVDSFMQADEKARASEALTIRSIEARTVAEKAAIAAERERISLAGQAISDDDRRQRIEAARQATFAQSTRESQDRLRDSTDANASAGLLSYPRQRAELEARYRKLFLESQGNLPAIANLQKSQALDSQAIDKEAIGGPLRDANRALNEQVAALKLQQDAFGASTEAAARMAETQRLVNQYAAAGVPISADMKRAIDAQAAAVGKVTAAQEELARKQREVIGGLDDIRSGSRNALTGIFSDVSQGKSPLDGLTSSLSGMASRVFDRTVSTPLVNSVFGLDGKAGGGMFGDALSGIFGKQQGLSTADITAGIVNVNGTVNAIPGLSAANGNVPGGASVASVAAGLTGTSSSDMDRYAKAIRTIESGSAAGNYEALGKITKTGDRAYGAYQVMGNNIPSWTQKALGRTLTPDEFLKDKAAQDAVFKDQFGASVKKYGADDAASIWLTGRTQARAGNAADANGTTAADYVGKFRRALPPASSAGPAETAAGGGTPALKNLDASLKDVGTTATTATQNVTSLTNDLGSLPNALTQTSQGVTQLGQSLGSGGGGGLLGALASLFGGGSGSSGTAAVTAAGGGHIRGPGSGTSDSIPARLSNGEFVVKASVTARNLPLLHALNDDRLPAFATGGPVGAVANTRAAGQPGSAGSGLIVNVNNAPSQPTVQEVPDGRGQRRLEITFDEAAARAVGRPGSKTAAVLSTPRVASR